jgi:RNA polymerase sigma factor (sigma-70 family)
MTIVTTITTHTDQYLIDGLAENDSAVINEIYKRYSGKMYNWLKQHNADYEQAQDVFQEAIIDIYRKATNQTFQLTCPFDAFLFVIIRNKWYTYLKKNKTSVVTNTDDFEYTNMGIAQDDAKKVMQYENQHKLLLEKLELLHDGCKELLKLSWSGLGMDEVADKLKVTYAYVRKKKSLCMAKLIESIKGSEQYHELSFTTT